VSIFLLRKGAKARPNKKEKKQKNFLYITLKCAPLILFLKRKRILFSFKGLNKYNKYSREKDF